MRIRLALTLLLTTVAAADTIHLQNGDRLTGKVTAISGGKVIIQTEYAGTIDIKLDAVVGIDTDEPVAIEQKDGKRLITTLTYEGEEQRASQHDEAFALSEIERIAVDEKALDEADKKANKTWSGTLDSAAVFRSGETDSLDALIGITTVRKKKSNTLTLKLNSAYGETDDRLNTQRARGEAKWQYYPKQHRMYYFLVSSAEHDKLRRLEFRTTGGGGAGLDIIKNDKRKLSAEGGLEYTYERWENFGIGEYRALENAAKQLAFDNLLALLQNINGGSAGLEDLLGGPRLIASIFDPGIGEKIRTETYWSGRISGTYEQSIFGKSKISDEILLLPNLDEFGEFRVTNILALTTPLTDLLSLRAILRTEYESDPGGEDVENLDNILTLGVQWKF